MSTARSRAVHTLARMVLGVSLAACGDDATSPDVDREPQFNAVVTGGDLPRLDGIAVFRVEPYNGGNDHGFALHLIDDNVSGEVVLRTLTTNLPAVGTYAVVPAEDREDPTEFRGSLSYAAGGVLQEFEIRSGSIRITAARGAQIEGTLEVRARRVLDGQQVFVSATFSARRHDEVLGTSGQLLYLRLPGS